LKLFKIQDGENAPIGTAARPRRFTSRPTPSYPRSPSRGGPVYLGISGNLAQRDFDTHFTTGQSGFSTLRRSIGAILRDDLKLKPRPRGTGASDTNYRNYRFDDAGERSLTKWMTTNLLIGAEPIDEPKLIEKQLIALACPPLNLTHWANPDAPTIKAARKACVEAARETRR
jgi:hypothetical protein